MSSLFYFLFYNTYFLWISFKNSTPLSFYFASLKLGQNIPSLFVSYSYEDWMERWFKNLWKPGHAVLMWDMMVTRLALWIKEVTLKKPWENLFLPSLVSLILYIGSLIKLQSIFTWVHVMYLFMKYLLINFCKHSGKNSEKCWFVCVCVCCMYECAQVCSNRDLGMTLLIDLNSG